MTLLIDNYDSFSYNLYQLVGSIDPDITVIRNDAHTVEEIRKMQSARIILSPGPGHPRDAGVCMDVVRELKGDVPILGVCLGHQAICEVFGATVATAKTFMHGKQSMVEVVGDFPLFEGLPKKLPGARYHSLAVLSDTLPEELQVVARAEDGEVMAVTHMEYPIYGLQFHPESILTPDGKQILKNFMEVTQS